MIMGSPSESSAPTRLQKHAWLALDEARQAFQAVRPRSVYRCRLQAEWHWNAALSVPKGIQEPDTRCTAQAVSEGCECAAAHAAARAWFT